MAVKKKETKFPNQFSYAFNIFSQKSNINPQISIHYELPKCTQTYTNTHLLQSTENSYENFFFISKNSYENYQLPIKELSKMNQIFKHRQINSYENYQLPIKELSKMNQIFKHRQISASPIHHSREFSNTH